MIGNSYISEVVFRYAGILNRAHDRDGLLELIADMGKELVRADRCSIWLIDADKEHIYTKIAQQSSEIRMKNTKGLVGKCIQTGRTILNNNPRHDGAFAASIDTSTGYRTTSVLVVPMRRADGTVVGAFQALNKVGGFSKADTELLGLAASFSVVVIENQALQMQAEATRQLQRDLEIARDVQGNMLPRDELLRVRGFEISAYCRPASEVGGDFYDFLHLPRSFSISVGDVSGKGIGAAITMASQQSAIRSIAPHLAQFPAQLCAELNRSTYMSSSPERYATLFFASCCLSSESLTYCNAGHVFPYIIRADGSMIQLKTGGPPIGLLPNPSFECERVSFKQGDTLLCYSDGLSECQDASGNMWQDAFLPDILLDIRNLSAKSSVAKLLSMADQFAKGCPQFDDITLVCVRSRSE